jgi:hypothetical protein
LVAARPEEEKGVPRADIKEGMKGVEGKSTLFNESNKRDNTRPCYM